MLAVVIENYAAKNIQIVLPEQKWRTHTFIVQ